MLVDTHTHLQWPSFSSDRAEVIERARMRDVKAIEIAKQHEGVFAAVGIHPHNANSFTESTVRTLGDLAREGKVVAIGEIGLDFYRNLSSRDFQSRVVRSEECSHQRYWPLSSVDLSGLVRDGRVVRLLDLLFDHVYDASDCVADCWVLSAVAQSF